MNARSLLVRGMLVGVLAGLLACAFAAVFGEPPVNAAIALEDAAHAAAEHSHAAHAAAEPEVVSRAVQGTLGLGTAAVVYGVAIGGLFALAFAVAYGRIARFGVRGTALLVAATGFVVVALVPFLKYPANPPAVGRSESIGDRTGLYFLMVAVAALAAALAAVTARGLTERLGGGNAATAAVGVFVLVVGVAGWVMPSISEVPEDFPAELLWHFRIASLGTQFTLWVSLGLVFGALTERAAHRSVAVTPPPVPVA